MVVWGGFSGFGFLRGGGGGGIGFGLSLVGFLNLVAGCFTSVCGVGDLVFVSNWFGIVHICHIVIQGMVCIFFYFLWFTA